MEKKTKMLLLVGPSLMAMVFGLTSPIVEIYFMKLVSAKILALSNILGIGLAAVVQSTVPSAKIKRIYRQNAYKIIIFVTILFVTVSLLSTEYVEVRFLGFAVLNALTSSLWMVLIMDAVNRKIGGDELTNWNATASSFRLYASLIGCCLAIFVADIIPIDIAIWIQCFAITVYGLSDIFALKKLYSN